MDKSVTMKMNKFFAAGAVATFAILSWTLNFSPAESLSSSASESSVYVPRSLNGIENSPDGAWEIQKLMRGDISTGEMNESGLNELRDEVIRMATQQSENDRDTEHYWNEMGPDNIGGRTRALAAVIPEDGSEETILYAGSVSGGLWKSDNGGNDWNQMFGIDNRDWFHCSCRKW
jgi:hypothetical protein